MNNRALAMYVHMYVCMYAYNKSSTYSPLLFYNKLYLHAYIHIHTHTHTAPELPAAGDNFNGSVWHHGPGRSICQLEVSLFDSYTISYIVPLDVCMYACMYLQCTYVYVCVIYLL